MKYLLPLLLLTAPALAQDSPREELTGEEICAVVEHELDQAVEFGHIGRTQATNVLIRCFVNYS